MNCTIGNRAGPFHEEQLLCVDWCVVYQQFIADGFTAFRQWWIHIILLTVPHRAVYGYVPDRSFLGSLSCGRWLNERAVCKRIIQKMLFP